MKKFILATTLCSAVLLGNGISFGQEKCGLDITTRELISKNPELANLLDEHSKEAKLRAETYEMQMVNSANKTTAQVAVPVVFHIVLNQSQIDAMGGLQTIYLRVKSQMDVINNDYNARNSDSFAIPAGFKPLYGNPGISFGLAHTKPDGTGTDGIEVKIVPESTVGFDAHANTPKKTAYGGLDPWDNTKYLNIWVINLTTSGSGGEILGYAYSPDYAKNFVGDASQMGVVIDFGTLGVMPVSTVNYWHPSATRGRTLTHELGHFFNLWHTWGNSAVGSGSCGDDDDVDDTPKQFDATQNCQQFPYVDQCTPGGNGVMYMNYMDYSGDDCTRMFSKQQAARMHVEVLPGGGSYSLTQNPKLFSWPTAISNVEKENTFSVYPNPSAGIFNISFENTPKDLNSIKVSNAMGQLVQEIPVTENKISYTIDLSGAAKGMYMVHLNFAEGTVIRKVMLQ